MSEGRLNAALSITAAIVLGVSLVGFFVGTSRSDYDFELPALEASTAPPSVDVPYALSYAELRDSPRGANSSGLDEDLARMRLVEGAPPEGPKEPALADRARLRAYDGAPPRIPHPIRQDSAAECLACHDEGLRFRGRLAPPMSHREMTSCTQCHVVDEAPMPGGADLPPDPRAVPSTFAGLASPTAGPRAWSIAPPQIPHRTWMRERCTSCHGPYGRAPIRSSHTHRQSCEQCHTTSPEADPRPVR